MKILLSNDDGFDAKGIIELSKKLEKIANVITIAPSFEQSAKGHAFTMAKPLRLKKSTGNIYHLNGTPADCVYLGLHHLLPDADVVVSGMNHGANLGQDVYYSGTVAAAREGAMQGKKAIAVSILEQNKTVDFEKAAEIAVQIIVKLLKIEWKEGVYWNVNIPADVLAQDVDEIPVVVKPLGRRRYHSAVEERKDPRGNTYFWLGGSPIPTEKNDSDSYWCERGYVVLTPLQLDCTNQGHPLLDTDFFDCFE